MIGMSVVPRKGDVDRNDQMFEAIAQGVRVVPRKGDVDRNPVGSEENR